MYQNVDMAFQDGVHVLKYSVQGASSVQIVKFSKSFASSSDVISVLELPVKDSMTGQEIVTGHLSVTQDNNGYERIAACLTVTT